LAWRNRENVRKWFRFDKELTLDQHLNWFAGYILKEDDFTFVFEVDSKPVGQFAIYNLDRKSQTAEVGRILLDESCQGKGYATEALAGLVQIAEIHLGCRSVWLEVKSDNARAIRVYQACGFTEVSADSGYTRMETECRSTADLRCIA
jgi:RimJ/RimL family protein N-acetyltransferase